MSQAGLQVFQYAVLIDAQGERHLLGSMVNPVNLNTDFGGEVRHQVFLVDAGDQINPEFGEFEFLWVRVNAEDCFIEVTTDVNNSVGRQSQTFKLRKNLPFVLGSRVSYANFTTSFGGGTLDVIDRIIIKNTGSATVTAEIVAAQ